MKKIILILVLILLCSFFAVNVFAFEPASAYCGEVVLSDLTLDRDLTCTENGLIIRGDDVTIDCNGYKITGDLSGADSGIKLDGRSGVTIKNCVIENFWYGINVKGSSDNNIIDNTGTKNHIGVYVSYNSDSNTITGNSFSNGGISGINVYSGSDNNMITNNIITDYYYSGIRVAVNSNNNIVTHNTASDSTRRITSTGITILESSNTYLEDNTADNNMFGIVIDESSYSTLKDNSMSGNKANFLLYGTQDSHFANEIDTSNLVDSKSIYYIKDESGTTYDSSTTPEIGAFYCINCDGVNLKDLTLTNNAWDVFFWETDNSIIENVDVLDNYLAGLGDIYGFDGGGIFLINSNYNTITDSTSSGNIDCNGIYLLGSSYNDVINNIFNDNDATGISVKSGDENKLNGNTADNNKKYGIYIRLSNNNELINNHVDNSILHGIYLSESSDNNLVGNTATNSYYESGILLLIDSNHNTLDSNTVTGNSEHGIYLSAADDNTFTSNTADDNENGVYLYVSNNNVFSENTITNNDNGVNIVSGAGNSIIENEISSNTVVDFMQDSGSSNNNIDLNYWGEYPVDCVSSFGEECPEDLISLTQPYTETCLGVDNDNDLYSTTQDDINKECCGDSQTCLFGIDCDDNSGEIIPGMQEILQCAGESDDCHGEQIKTCSIIGELAISECDYSVTDSLECSAGYCIVGGVCSEGNCAGGNFLDSDSDTVCDYPEDDFCLGTVYDNEPKMLKYSWLGGEFFKTLTWKKKLVDSKYEIGETKGCSCMQILDKLGLPAVLGKNGCNGIIMNKWIRNPKASASTTETQPINPEETPEKPKKPRLKWFGWFKK